ncbi:MAG: cytochrome c biogenesis protein CcsA [Prevotella sp.]|nr:cytochrome c biogenesis protein CcsA [Prevotella sp.]
MTWSYFIYFSLGSVLLWTLGAYAAWRDKSRLAYIATTAGLLVFFAFIVGMWLSLERPPLRTMGETRLWYSFFLPLAGIIVYCRWHYKWILSFSTLLAFVFICVNLFKPEIHNKTLMPALQSPWFAPHVIVYMFCYALLGAATVMAIYLLYRSKEEEARGNVQSAFSVGCGSAATKPGKQGARPILSEMDICDNLVYVGLAFMTIGMLFGALWAKEAWGHYWAWDPKETWAAITWFAYLAYIHYRLGYPQKTQPALWMLIIAFVLLQMCWWGINYLPAAQGASVHTYNLN